MTYYNYLRNWKSLNKYNAKKVNQDGITFDSKAEHEMYQLLKADRDTLHIDCHVPVTLPGGLRFNIDFVVYKKTENDTGRIEAIEVKGHPTQDFKRMLKLFNETHPLAPLQVFRKVGSRWINLDEIKKDE